MKKPVIFLMGPTGSGKTGSAIYCAQRIHLDVVSVDSALVYRTLDIGTAKPSSAELIQCPHRLINTIDPWQSYSAGQFRQDALACIEQIDQTAALPFLVGGTSLYFRALESGLADLPTADPEIREAINQRGEIEGWPALHAELQRRDPLSAKRIHPNDQQRIQRALEVIQIAGVRLSELQRQQDSEPLDRRIIKLCLLPGDRSKLYENLDNRFNLMIDNGFVKEVEGCFHNPKLSEDSPAMRCVGYRQLWQYFAGVWDLDTAIHEAKKATRRLAKRQLTWLRQEKDVISVDCQHPDMHGRVFELVTQHLKALSYPYATIRV